MSMQTLTGLKNGKNEKTFRDRGSKINENKRKTQRS